MKQTQSDTPSNSPSFRRVVRGQEEIGTGRSPSPDGELSTAQAACGADSRIEDLVAPSAAQDLSQKQNTRALDLGPSEEGTNG